MSSLSAGKTIRMLNGQEVHEAWLLESRCFPSDEAASEETLELRQREAPELFWGYFKDSHLIGLICCTKALGDKLTHESLYKHIPEGTLVCVHSVAVDQEYQRQGIATSLLKHLLQHVQENSDRVTKVSLLCHDELKLLYEKVGFECRGLSEVVHGFPVDIASPKEAVELWHREAPELCWGYYEDNRLVARICGTQSCDARYTDSCMRTHEPQGTMVGIHSLVVHQDSRGKGIGTVLMKRYLQHIKENLNEVNRVTLVCSETVKPFYENTGFQSQGVVIMEFNAGIRTPRFEMEYSILR